MPLELDQENTNNLKNSNFLNLDLDSQIQRTIALPPTKTSNPCWESELTIKNTFTRTSTIEANRILLSMELLSTVAIKAMLYIPINDDWKLGLPKKPNIGLYGLLQSTGSNFANCKSPYMVDKNPARIKALNTIDNRFGDEPIAPASSNTLKDR